MGHTLAFYGEKALNPNLVNDALGDQLRYGPLDSEGYFETRPDTIFPDLIFAADTEDGVKALAPILEWSARADLNYALILRYELAAQELEESTDTVERVGDAVTRLAEILRDDEESGEDAALVLLADMDTFDQSVTDLIRLTEGAVLVYNLGDALLPVDVAPFLDEAPGEGADPTGASIELASGTVPLERTAEKTAEKVIEQDKSMFEALREDLDALEESFVGQLHAVRDLIDVYETEFENEIKQLRAQTGVANEKAAPAPEPPAVEVAAPTKTKREWYDEETKTWKPMGRGRPRRNVEFREVLA